MIKRVMIIKHSKHLSLAASWCKMVGSVEEDRINIIFHFHKSFPLDAIHAASLIIMQQEFYKNN